MESTDPHTLSAFSDQLIYTTAHLSSRLIGKCDRQNIPWIHTALPNQIGNPMRQNSCLSGSGTCQNQKRSFRMTDSLSLGII
jgi:hypothetical protein